MAGWTAVANALLGTNAVTEAAKGVCRSDTSECTSMPLWHAPRSASGSKRLHTAASRKASRRCCYSKVPNCSTDVDHHSADLNSEQHQSRQSLDDHYEDRRQCNTATTTDEAQAVVADSQALEAPPDRGGGKLRITGCNVLACC